MRILFEQIQYNVWVFWCPMAAFLISFSVFLACLWRAWNLPKENAEHMANLPFDDSLEVSTPTHSSTSSVPHAKE